MIIIAILIVKYGLAFRVIYFTLDTWVFNKFEIDIKSKFIV